VAGTQPPNCFELGGTGSTPQQEGSGLEVLKGPREKKRPRNCSENIRNDRGTPSASSVYARHRVSLGPAVPSNMWRKGGRRVPPCCSRRVSVSKARRVSTGREIETTLFNPPKKNIACPPRGG